jgi:hypothetical protein
VKRNKTKKETLPKSEGHKVHITYEEFDVMKDK